MKKIKFIMIFVLFILSFIFHFAYDIIPNFFTSILFPVNESIFEHMKLISTSIIFASLLEYIILKKKKLFVNNFIFSKAISIIIGIPFYLAIYLPLNSLFKDNMLVAIFLLFVIFIITQIIQYYIEKGKEIKFSKVLGILLIIFIYIMFLILTYYPPKTRLFYDIKNKGYGIIKKED